MTRVLMAEVDCSPGVRRLGTPVLVTLLQWGGGWPWAARLCSTLLSVSVSTQRRAYSGEGLCGGRPVGCLGTGEACRVEGQRDMLKTAGFLAPTRQPSCQTLRLGAAALGLVLASATCSSDPRGLRVAVSITKHKEALCRALMICSLPLSRCARESQPTNDTQRCFLKVKEVI